MTEEITPKRKMSMKELEYDFMRASRVMWKILDIEEPNEGNNQKSF